MRYKVLAIDDVTMRLQPEIGSALSVRSNYFKKEAFRNKDGGWSYMVLGYATTIHSSQGSTLENVLAYNLFHGDESQQDKLAYVAGSRPTRGITIINAMGVIPAVLNAYRRKQ